MEQLIQKLKSLKNINPDRDYARRIRVLILAHKPDLTPQRFFFGWQTALALASLIVILITGLLIYNKNQSAVAQNNRGIKIGETQYNQESLNNISKFTLQIQNKVNNFFNKLVF